MTWEGTKEKPIIFTTWAISESYGTKGVYIEPVDEAS